MFVCKHSYLTIKIIFFSSLLATITMLFAFSEFYSTTAFSFNETDSSIVKNDYWISQRDDLNITIKLVPDVPVIDENTKILFEVMHLLNNSGPYKDLNTRVTITDHDGRLFKFENKLIPITNGQFSINYIFPDDGEHKIILQLYKNTTPFTVGSFDLVVPHPTALQSQTDKILKPFFDFFNSLW